MTISGFSMYDTSMYSLNTQSTNSSVEGGTGKPQGPPPSGGQQGPQVDTNEDGYWDSDELESMVSSLNEENGTSLSSSELMDEYDTDGDGLISSSESETFKDDNAFQLTKLEDAQGMMGGSMGMSMGSVSEESSDDSLSVDVSDDLMDTMLEILEEMQAEDEEAEETEESENNNTIMARAMQAYSMQSSYFDFSATSTYEETAI
jgi:hypothetical protein